jgi:hypothetical protein
MTKLFLAGALLAFAGSGGTSAQQLAAQRAPSTCCRADSVTLAAVALFRGGRASSSACLAPGLLPNGQCHRWDRLVPDVVAPTGAPDYRWEGLAMGAIAVGAVGALFANGICNDSDSGNPATRNCVLRTVEGALFGATLGGVVGGLLGGLIPKRSYSAWPDPAK